MWILHFLGLFAVGLVMDALWAINVRVTVEGKAKLAATTSALLVAGSAATLTDIVANGVLPLLGYALGAWVGTWLVVRRRRCLVNGR